MLGAIAAVILAVGAISATTSVVHTNQQMADRAGEPVVEVHAVQSLDSATE